MTHSLIEPIQQGAVLSADIGRTQLRRGEIALWWLGQSGYAIKTASTLFYVDLYLSEHLTQKYAATAKPHIRMTAAPIRIAEMPPAPYVFASHKHSDHFDPGTLPDLMIQWPQSRLVMPAALIDHAVSLGITSDRLIPTRGDETLRLGALTVHSLPSAHPGLDYDAATGYPYQGFVFSMDGLTVYHSGDTLVYPGLAERLRHFAPDVLLLPINGTDARRDALGVPPNMNAQEAVGLAQAVGAKLIIPHHYEMFTFNTADVSDFIALTQAYQLPCAALRCGEKFCWNLPT